MRREKAAAPDAIGLQTFVERKGWPHVCVVTEAACKFCLECGPAPIDQSLRGGHLLFNTVVLPNVIPDTLAELKKAQDVWISPLTKDATRPSILAPR